ncbi:acetyltransferase [Rudanella paleaurantiibacter]|uniref:Acetyltransferase n=1 Tax=Rudanella paleaurantiibacter TaxID=2614655 RepID=A0A7J5TX11_9BACT|nr:acetyltransferase [Rudanella paleaurantiibacter]KAB7729178.1 acetyltransferase [Rudanella paleaurantiibacter]
MNPPEILLYGAGGHARVLLSVLKALGYRVAGVFDDDLERQFLGELRVWGRYEATYRPEVPLLLAVGDNSIRRALAATARHSFATVIHPSALVDVGAELGAGTVILHQAVVQTGAVLGQHVLVNTRASVDHDCRLGDFVQIAPGAVLCGGVHVGEGALIAAGAVVVPGVSVGRWAVVGAGAVVTRPVPDGAVVWGNPARFIRQNSLSM